MTNKDIIYLFIYLFNNKDFFINKKLTKKITVEDLKHDWKKLQDCYRQAMLRRKTKSGQSATKTKPWKYEELMSFLASDTLPRR